MKTQEYNLDLVEHLYRQRDFSIKTFGPGQRCNGILDHIQKEMLEIRENPCDLFEWIDVIILALDGAWRAGWSPEQIAAALLKKQTINENRRWPDWETLPRDGRAIEHIREHDAKTD